MRIAKVDVLLASAFSPESIGGPLRQPVFRRIWTASLLSNMGILIQGVGAAWAMTQLTHAADWIALVQTAAMLPIMLMAIPAGAVADMYDRRVVGLVAIAISFVGATILAGCTFLGFVSPPLLLAFCFIIGTGVALFGPAWQASASEQVPPESLPSAVALNSISYNIARSFGPAVGGLIVAAAGAAAAYVANAVFYVPLFVVLYRWQRLREKSRLPPENLGRAIISGVRYIMHSPQILVVLLRCAMTSLAGSSVAALMPLIASDLLGGDAQTYGIMLGAFGVGAVASSFNVPLVRRSFDHEHAVRACLLAQAIASGVVGISHTKAVTIVALAVVGAAWMLSNSLYNIGVQLSSPRWVSGRVLASYQAVVAGGLAFGGWGWGMVTRASNLETALFLSAAGLIVTLVVGVWIRMPLVASQNADAISILADPEVKLSITGRSGPIILEIEYRIAQENARVFYDIMADVQLSRQRNGAYGWSLARDVANPEIWIERLHYPTWHDYLRQRNRQSQSERNLQARAQAFHIGPEPVRIRRMLERPFGSVRWSDDVPDRAPPVLPITTPSSSGT